MTLLRIFVMTALMLFAFGSSADSLPQLTQYLRTQITQANSVSRPGGRPVSTDDSYFLRRWLVRLQALVGIDVPGLVSFQIVPEVELVWQRTYPQGWGDYKP